MEHLATLDIKTFEDGLFALDNILNTYTITELEIKTSKNKLYLTGIDKKGNIHTAIIKKKPEYVYRNSKLVYVLDYEKILKIILFALAKEYEYMIMGIKNNKFVMLFVKNNDLLDNIQYELPIIRVYEKN